MFLRSDPWRDPRSWCTASTWTSCATPSTRRARPAPQRGRAPRRPGRRATARCPLARLRRLPRRRGPQGPRPARRGPWHHRPPTEPAAGCCTEKWHQCYSGPSRTPVLRHQPPQPAPLWRPLRILSQFRLRTTKRVPMSRAASLARLTADKVQPQSVPIAELSPHLFVPPQTGSGAICTYSGASSSRSNVLHRHTSIGLVS